VNEGLKSIANGDLCVMIMMGEHGEQSIQSNLESYNNLDAILNDFEKRKSNIFRSNRSNVHLETINETIEEEKSIREIEAKELFVNKLSLENKKKKDNLFIPNQEKGLNFDDLLKNKENPANLEEKENLFEKALKEEKQSRKNPLKLLEVFIKRIQRLCNKILQVIY
jgi:hypothetical protein